MRSSSPDSGRASPTPRWTLVIDEVLRIDDPFITNRRVTTRPMDLAGVRLPQGARVKLHGTSANRDETIFGDAETFDPSGDAADNLVYGIGKHSCPGRLMATVELRIAVRAPWPRWPTSLWSRPAGRTRGRAVRRLGTRSRAAHLSRARRHDVL